MQSKKPPAYKKNSILELLQVRFAQNKLQPVGLITGKIAGLSILKDPSALLENLKGSEDQPQLASS